MRGLKIVALHNNWDSRFLPMKQVLVTILSAAVYITGCVSDDAVIMDGQEPYWEKIESPITCENPDCIAIDEGGNIFAGWDCMWMTGAGAFPLQSYRAHFNLFASRNSGESWEDTGFMEGYVESITAGRNGHIFVLSVNDRYRIHRSSDGGGTWTEIGTEFEDLCCSEMVADSEGWIFLDISGEGLYRSKDNGDSWARVFDDAVRCIAFGPAGAVYIGAAKGGLYRSDSRGDSWYCVDSTVGGCEYINQIAVDSAGRIFVKAIGADTTCGLHRSTDEGDTWEGLCVQESCYPPSGIFITPGNTVFASYYRGLYRSEDNGDTWARIESGYLNSMLYGYDYDFRNVISLEADPYGRIFVLTERAIYRSGDNGDTWTITGMPFGDVTGIALDPGGRWWGTFRSGGVYFSPDNLLSWNQFNDGLVNIYVRCLAIKDDGSVLAGTSTGIYASPTDHVDWSYMGPDTLLITDVITGHGDCIIAGTSKDGIFISCDGGDTWTLLGMAGYNVTSVRMDGGGDIYAGADFGGVFRYTGEGILWDQLNEGLEDLHLLTMASSPAGRLYAGTRDGVYRMNADGLRWEKLGLEGHTPREIYIDDGDNVFVVAGDGVFKRSPVDSKWESMNEGLYRAHIYCLAVGQDNHLYLFGRYIYRSEQTVD